MTKEFDPARYWDERLHSLKGLQGVGFKKLGHAFNVWAYKVRRRIFLRKVRELNIRLDGTDVLDIGSGTGFYIDIWQKLGVRSVTGTDLTPTATRSLTEQFPGVSFFQADIGDPQFKAPASSPKFTVISCMDVLFHIVDDERFAHAIRNISELLAPGGLFIYSDLYLKKRGTMRGESQVCRTAQDLERIFSNNGFELVSMSPFLYLTNTPLDSKNPLIKAYWYLLHNTLYAMPFLGHIIGAALYPLELMLTSVSADSPTTEIAVYRKKAV